MRSVLCRIGDVCLFLSGLFPSAIEAEYRYPLSGDLRPRARACTVASRDDYEAHGRAFYRLAAEHEMAQWRPRDPVGALHPGREGASRRGRPVSRVDQALAV